MRLALSCVHPVIDVEHVEYRIQAQKNAPGRYQSRVLDVRFHSDPGSRFAVTCASRNELLKVLRANPAEIEENAVYRTIEMVWSGTTRQSRAAFVQGAGSESIAPKKSLRAARRLPRQIESQGQNFFVYLRHSKAEARVTYSQPGERVR